MRRLQAPAVSDRTRHRARSTPPTAFPSDLDPGLHETVDVPCDLRRVAKRGRRLQSEQEPRLTRMLKHVRDAVDDQRRDRRRPCGEPALALLADHDRFELDVVRTKELLGQAADRSAGVCVERDPCRPPARPAARASAPCRSACAAARRRTRPSAAACSRRAARARTRSARPRSAWLPGARTTSAFTVSPQRSSGTPMTATSATSGCCDERLLDLDGIHVLAAADDHVLDPVGEEEVAIVVEVAAVAGAQPAVRRSARPRSPRAGVVPGHDVRRAEPHLADLARSRARRRWPGRRSAARPTGAAGRPSAAGARGARRGRGRRDRAARRRRSTPSARRCRRAEQPNVRSAAFRTGVVIGDAPYAIDRSAE